MNALPFLCTLLIGAPPDTPSPERAEAVAKRLAPFFRPPAEFTGDLGKFRSPLRFDDGKPVHGKANWPRRRQEILKAWHDLMGPWPPLIERPRLDTLKKERRDGLTQHHIRLEVAPGRSTEDAYLLIPDGQGPFPAVLVVFYDAKTGIGQGKSAHCDFAYQLARRGFVTLSLGSPPASYYPSKEKAQLQPLSFHAYVAANCANALGRLPQVDTRRIGIVGHSYGGKWALFASCLCEKFACAVWSDGGVVFDERRSNVNYWEPWYLGHEAGKERRPGIPTEKNPRTGAYRKLVESGRDLHELHSLMAPRPFLVSGGSEDPPERWKALNHALAVNRLLGYEGRVAMTNRKGHAPTEESNEQLYLFFEHVLKHGKMLEDRLQAEDAKVRIVALGDSITRGVRPGMKAEETFAALLQADLRKQKIEAEVLNAGVGGERTDQALKRLARAVLVARPRIVLIMYGTNDSYVDRDQKESRLSVEQYRANLKELIAAVRKNGIEPVLMTPPCWGNRAGRNGVGEHPNLRLEKYVKACREVSKETRASLVDHFAHWSRAASTGTDLGAWTTDQCHPNPRGHREIADRTLPVILSLLRRK